LISGFSAKSKTGLKGVMENNPSGEEMNEAKPVRCQKSGKPLGYITLFIKGLVMRQAIHNVEIVARAKRKLQSRQVSS